MPYVHWDDHSAHVMGLVGILYKSLELTDCTLDTNGGFIRGHKTLLAACSPYLKKLIVDYQGMEIIPLKEVRYSDMKLILDFVYFGEVDVSHTDVPSVMETARLLQIPHLRDFPSTISEKSSSNVSSEVSVYDYGTKCCVNLIKYEDSDSIVQDTKSICNRDINHENKCTLTANSEDICESKTHAGSGVKISSETPDKIPMINNDEESSVRKIDLINEREENVQDASTPFCFVAVSPFSVNSAHSDEVNDFCGTQSDVENPLEEYRENNDTTKEIIKESGVQSESEVKKEIKEEDNVSESDNVYESVQLDYISHGMWNSTLKNTANICGKEITQKLSLIETVGGVSSKAIFADGMADLQMELESVCDVSKFELSEVQPLETTKGNESVDANNDLVTANATVFPESSRLMSCAQPPAKEMHLEGPKEDFDCIHSKLIGFEMTRDFTENVEYAKCTRKGGARHSANESSELKVCLGNICDQSLNRSETHKQHMCVHAGKEQYLCNICNASFRRKYNLTVHVRNHTGDKPFQCDICGATFSLNNHLKRHKLIHAGIKPFKCDICGTSFTQSSHLKTHKRSHAGIKPFICDVCGSLFSAKSSLMAHKRIHSGIKPFKCDICGATFTQNSQLKTHKRTHTGIKPFNCDICGSLFSAKSSLMAHKRIHAGIKPFQCDICGATFTQNSHLKSHKHIHTRIKTVQL